MPKSESFLLILLIYSKYRTVFLSLEPGVLKFFCFGNSGIIIKKDLIQDIKENFISRQYDEELENIQGHLSKNRIYLWTSTYIYVVDRNEGILLQKWRDNEIFGIMSVSDYANKVLAVSNYTSTAKIKFLNVENLEESFIGPNRKTTVMNSERGHPEPLHFWKDNDKLISMSAGEKELIGMISNKKSKVTNVFHGHKHCHNI